MITVMRRALPFMAAARAATVAAQNSGQALGAHYVAIAFLVSDTGKKISFDAIVETMYRTGRDLNEKYRETAHGGLAAIYGKIQH